MIERPNYLPKSQVGVLDPEIANEGLLVKDEELGWTPPPAKPVIPDISQVKSIRQYFGRTGHQVYPAWLYHPTAKAKLVKDADEAAKLGVTYRYTTPDERARYGVRAMWDFEDGSDWRAAPWTETSFDPANPGPGKQFVAGMPSAAVAPANPNLVAEVAAAVAKAIRAPSGIDPTQWEEFLAFQAWRKSAEIAPEAVAEAEAAPPPSGNALNALTPEQDRQLWLDEAERKGVKVDGRWSLERIRAEVEKAA